MRRLSPSAGVREHAVALPRGERPARGGHRDQGDATFAVVVLVVGSLVHVVGEMIGSGGQWGLQMGLAPHERQGQYQGFAGLGFSVIAVVGPPVVTLLCVEMGETGWLVLAALMLGVALVSVPASRWALDSRERYGVLTHSG